MTFDEAVEFVDGIDEEDAHLLLRAIKRQFNWVGSIWTLDDVRVCIREIRADMVTLSDDDVEDLVNAVVGTRWWNRSMDEVMTEHGWEVLGIAVEEALIELPEAD